MKRRKTPIIVSDSEEEEEDYHGTADTASFNNAEEREDCSICLSEMLINPPPSASSDEGSPSESELSIASLPACVHRFHLECIESWTRVAKGTPSCPCCKAEFNKIVVHCRGKRTRFVSVAKKPVEIDESDADSEEEEEDEFEDDETCHICNEPEYLNSTDESDLSGAFLLCEGVGGTYCDARVHRFCVGAGDAPDEKWRCSECLVEWRARLALKPSAGSSDSRSRQRGSKASEAPGVLSSVLKRTPTTAPFRPRRAVGLPSAPSSSISSSGNGTLVNALMNSTIQLMNGHGASSQRGQARSEVSSLASSPTRSLRGARHSPHLSGGGRSAAMGGNVSLCTDSRGLLVNMPPSSTSSSVLSSSSRVSTAPRMPGSDSASTALGAGGYDSSRITSLMRLQNMAARQREARERVTREEARASQTTAAGGGGRKRRRKSSQLAREISTELERDGFFVSPAQKSATAVHSGARQPSSSSSSAACLGRGRSAPPGGRSGPLRGLASRLPTHPLPRALCSPRGGAGESTTAGGEWLLAAGGSAARGVAPSTSGGRQSGFLSSSGVLDVCTSNSCTGSNGGVAKADMGSYLSKLLYGGNKGTAAVSSSSSSASVGAAVGQSRKRPPERPPPSNLIRKRGSERSSSADDRAPPDS